MVVADVRPRGPYSLQLSARHAGDATRTFRDAVFDAELPAGRGVAWQRPDGTMHLRATCEEALEQLRWCLGIDDDHTPFLLRFGNDPFLGRAIRMLRGLRPLRTATVAQALLRALCGQLILASEARALERRIIRAATEKRTSWRHAPPTAADLTTLSPARLRALKEQPTATVADHLNRERGLGPWSSGVVCLEGLGRFERGLEGDLGLVKLLAAMRGRRVEGWETAELLEPYGEWAGLASVYMLTGRGYLPVAAAA